MLEPQRAKADMSLSVSTEVTFFPGDRTLLLYERLVSRCPTAAEAVAVTTGTGNVWATLRPHDAISQVYPTADTCLLWESSFPPQDPQIPVSE